MTTEEGTLTISTETDIVTARTTIREVATDVGFGLTDTTRIVTAVSELARNVYLYADSGTMHWRTETNRSRQLLEIVFDDDGPGIADVERALEEGYSTANGMGHGLSGTQKLMDEFEIETSSETGTTVTVHKYLS
ncbi:anti-sigma regulatory factor (plasmid) [Halorarum halophilum]|uniref:Anti-sigma regulatory factor n=1 Tax=Halorarum halophilum TaxID=2743090 RepID=A0A7D5KIB2_9EURY|nr:anti-sigma regulatory factor [Halobaculum halophilum]QLG29876.1 anti-sigma regulatory factor [Halobaculum halophilum]